MKLIVGLGNPGFRYSNTRHNIGFKVIKLLAKRHKIRLIKRQYGAKVGYGSIKNSKVILALPLEFMNLSGNSVKALVNAKDIERRDLLVVCDDINLNFGLLRIRAKGTAGGHKGLNSVIEHLGSDDFSRLRAGVGKEGLSGDITDFVLGNFTRQEKLILNNVLTHAAAACEKWIESGTEQAATKFNRKVI